MPRLHAKHRTEIRYAGAVGESVNEIRLVPSDNGRQQVEWSHVRVQPGAELLGHRDAYGNEVRWFQLTEPHETLVVEAEAIVTTRPGTRKCVARAASDSGTSEIPSAKGNICSVDLPAAIESASWKLGTGRLFVRPARDAGGLLRPAARPNRRLRAGRR